MRLDRNHLRRLDAQMPEVVMLRDCSRLHGQLTADKLCLTNQVRNILWRYYPQFLEISSGLSRLWVLELWMLAPTPHKANHLRLSSIERLLKKHSDALMLKPSSSASLHRQ